MEWVWSGRSDLNGSHDGVRIFLFPVWVRAGCIFTECSIFTSSFQPFRAAFLLCRCSLKVPDIPHCFVSFFGSPFLLGGGGCRLVASGAECVVTAGADLFVLLVRWNNVRQIQECAH